MMDFNEIGFEVLDDMISPDEVDTLVLALSAQPIPPTSGGVRRIEQLVPEVGAFASSEKLLKMAKRYLTSTPHLVRAIYFDKTPENNWYVTWHQDRTVAVSARFEKEGWGPWTLKAGVWHVQPPLAVLESMVTIRVHLDPSTRLNGCLKFIAGSHLNGIIPTSQVSLHLQHKPIVYCEAARGSAIIMRPHIFHASEKSMLSDPRRVLHFEYSSYTLPEGVSWSE